MSVKTTKRVTNRQDWPAYNAAQTAEKQPFMALMTDSRQSPTRKLCALSTISAYVRQPSRGAR